MGARAKMPLVHGLGSAMPGQAGPSGSEMDG